MGDQLRRQSWGGAKRYVKQLLGAPGVAQVAHRAVERFAPERGPQRLPVPWTVRQVHGRAAEVSFTMLDPGRCVVAKELYWGHGRRPGAADQLALDAFARLASRAELIVDVGAYTGIFSLIGALASPTARVEAFELVPENYVALVRNLVANDLVSGRVRAHLAGVGAPGATVRVPSGRGGSALPDFYSTDTDFASSATVTVPLVELDSISSASISSASINSASINSVLINSASINSVLIKIDVEGAEDVVLTHAALLLQTYRPTILCEVLPERGSAEVLNSILEPHGYRYFKITDHGLVSSDRIHGAAEARDWLITTETTETLQSIGLPVGGSSA